MKVKSWLFTTARNKALNYIKKHKESPLASDFDWGNNAEEENFESRDILEQGLKRLTPEERSLVLLRDLEGYDYLQIAELANIPSQHVKARLFRARKKLKTVIGKILTPTLNG